MIDKEKCLFVSYFFPPIHSVESTMAINSVKYLPEYGWEPIILSSRISKEFGVDNSGEHHQSQFSILRTGSWDNLFTRLFNKLGLIPDAMYGWLPFAMKASQSIDFSQVKVIISRSNPITSHLVAKNILRLMPKRVPWIAMFGDLWTQNPYIDFLPRRVIRYRDKIELDIMQNADLVIVTTELSKKLLVAKYGRENKIHVLPNTFDPAEFVPYSLSATSADRNQPMVMSYAGNFYGLRSPEPILKAMRWLIDQNKLSDRSIELRLIGSLGGFQHLIDKYNLSSCVKVLGKLPRMQAINQLSQSDVLVLIDAPSKEESIFLPTKLVEYLALGKPILGITPSGESAKLIIQSKTGSVADPEDTEAIAAIIGDYYRSYQQGTLKIVPDIDVIRKYRADNYGHELSQLLHQLMR